MTKVYSLTVLVIDHDELGAVGVQSAIENARYSNHCIAPIVMYSLSAEVDWSDDHPLNKIATMRTTFDELFDPGGESDE